jgi:hypothetical protein
MCVLLKTLSNQKVANRAGRAQRQRFDRNRSDFQDREQAGAIPGLFSKWFCKIMKPYPERLDS